MSTKINNSNNIYNFPFLNKKLNKKSQKQIQTNVNSANGVNGANEDENVLNELENENDKIFNYNTFINYLKEFEKSDKSNLNNELLEFNINNPNYQPNSVKKADQQITQLYIIPELYILYSKLYSSFQERQTTTFDFLDSFDDFYRLSQYTFSHENPNIRSINKLIRDNSDKKKNNNLQILFDDYKKILTDIKDYQNENIIIISKLIDLIKKFKNISLSQKTNISELKKKINNLFSGLQNMFKDKNDFNVSSSQIQNTMFSNILGINEYKDFIIFFQKNNNFTNINSLQNSNKINNLDFNSLNNFLNALKEELNDFNNKTIYFKQTDDLSEIKTETTKRSNYLEQINRLKIILIDISTLYFKIFKKNINSSTKNFLEIINILNNKESKFTQFNELLKNIQLIDSELKYDAIQNEQIINKNILQNYIDLKKQKDEEKQKTLEEKKNYIKTNIIDKKKELIKKLNDLKNLLNNLLVLNVKNNINSQSDELLTFLSKWFDIIIKIKCIELSLIFILIKESSLNSENLICDELKDFKIDQNLQMEMRNRITETFNNINTYYTSFIEDIKIKIEDTKNQIDLIENELKSLKDEPRRLNEEIQKEERIINPETQKIKEAETKIQKFKSDKKQEEAKPSRNLSKISQIDFSIETEEQKISNSRLLLNEAIPKKKDLTIQKLKIESKIAELNKTKETLSQQDNNYKSFKSELIRDGNEIRKDKLKDIVEKINDIYIIVARIYGLHLEFEKKSKEIQKTSSQNDLISLFEKDTLYIKMNRLIEVNVIKKRIKGTNIVENNSTKRGLKRYSLTLNKSVQNFKTNTLPILIEYFNEKLKYHNEKESILSAFTFNNASILKLPESLYKNLESQKLELNPLLQNLNSTTLNSSSSSSTNISTRNTSFNSTSTKTSQYGRSTYGGSNINILQKNKINETEKKKNKEINIYLEAIDKKLDILKNKLTSNENYQNRLNIFINTIDSYDKTISEKILDKLLKIQKMNNPQYKFIFAQQIRFIIRRLFKIQQFTKNLKSIFEKNNSFNLVNNFYITDLFLMYLSLNIVFYNFISCIHSKPIKNKSSMNY